MLVLKSVARYLQQWWSRLRLAGRPPLPYQARRAQLLMFKTKRELARLATWQATDPERSASAWYTSGPDRRYRTPAAYHQDARTLEVEEARLVAAHLLQVELEALAMLQRDGIVDRETARTLAQEVTARLQTLPALMETE